MDSVNLLLKPGSIDSLGNVVAKVHAADSTKPYAIWETTKGQVLCDADIDLDPNVSVWTAKVTDLTSLDMALEDLAGNRIGRPFDVDTLVSPAERITQPTTALSFRIQ